MKKNGINTRLKVNGSTAGRLKFVKDPATGHMMISQGNNVVTLDLKTGRAPGAAPAPGAVIKSEVDERLARLMGEEGPPPEVRTVSIFGEDWFLERVDFEKVTLVGLLQPRNKRNRMRISGKGNMTGLLAAMLFVICKQDATGTSDYFPTWEDAYRFAANRAPKVVETNHRLFEEMIELNPEVLPKQGVEVEEVDAPEDELDPS